MKAVMRSRCQKVLNFQLPATPPLSQAEWLMRVRGRPHGVPVRCCKESRHETPDVRQLKLYAVSDDSPPRRRPPLLSTQKHVYLWRCFVSSDWFGHWLPERWRAVIRWPRVRGEWGKKKTQHSSPWVKAHPTLMCSIPRKAARVNGSQVTSLCWWLMPLLRHPLFGNNSN